MVELMNTQHTPGPWVLNADWFEDDLKNHVPVSAMQERGGHLALAQVVWVMDDDRRMGRGSPVCEANARLIAAAPELLAAVRSAHHMLTRDYIDPAKLAVIEKCSAAIGQATGEEPF